jgi:hypothetical protein
MGDLIEAFLSGVTLANGDFGTSVIQAAIARPKSFNPWPPICRPCRLQPFEGDT